MHKFLHAISLLLSQAIIAKSSQSTCIDKLFIIINKKEKHSEELKQTEEQTGTLWTYPECWDLPSLICMCNKKKEIGTINMSSSSSF